MKVYIGNYVSRKISNFHSRYMEKRYGLSSSGENLDWIDNTVEYLEDVVQTIYNCTINLVLDRLEQRVDVRIDKHDTYSMDHTLAVIILPMLKQLKETTHGAPAINMKDVPKALRATKKEIEDARETGETDANFFKRWDWILDEMIWAFEQKCRDNWEADYYNFDDFAIPDDENSEIFGDTFTKTFSDRYAASKPHIDAHQKRMSNGFRLFGVYFESLWD